MPVSLRDPHQGRHPHPQVPDRDRGPDRDQRDRLLPVRAGPLGPGRHRQRARGRVRRDPVRDHQRQDVPGAGDQAPFWLTIFTSMFLHGSLLHLGGNMLFLWIFGNNIEDSMGRLTFVVFYLLGGLAALGLQVAWIRTRLIPTVGASGAIAAVLGAYARLYPRARVVTLIIIIIFFTVVTLPALLVLGLWFLLQLLPAFSEPSGAPAVEWPTSPTSAASCSECSRSSCSRTTCTRTTTSRNVSLCTDGPNARPRGQSGDHLPPGVPDDLGRGGEGDRRPRSCSP